MKRLFCLFVLLFSSISVYSQVAVYPQAAFLDSKNRSTSITLSNGSDKTKEVEITFKFGYMKYDSLGRQNLCMEDSVFEKAHSCIPYISVYPKRVMLKGNQQQKVKIMAKNFADLPDGMYWMRIISTASDIKKEVDTTNYDKISISLDIKFALMTVCFFTKGQVNTEVDIKSLTSRADSAKINLLLNISKGGNAPFLGKANVKIKDSKGDEVTAFEEPFPIYDNALKAISIDKEKLKPGIYIAEIEVTNEHQDVPKDVRVPFKPFTKKFEFRVD